MHFAAPLPVWLVIAAVAAIVGVAVAAYRRPLMPLSPSRRLLLAALRAAVLATLVVFLARPTLLVPSEAREMIVPILVDVSRSMSVRDDADGPARIDVASRLLSEQLLPALGGRFKTEVYAFGASLSAAATPTFTADARRTDVDGALAAVKDRYRGRALAGVVVLSDGADTEVSDTGEIGDGPPVYAIGVGTAAGPRDREVLGIAAGDPKLDAATVDLTVTAVSRGFGREPFQLRVLADGRVVDTASVTPAADGTPLETTFTVSPNPAGATVYTAEVSAAAGDAIVENDRRSVLVSPPGRNRRILAVQGAPGYDHSFLARAIAADPSLELDLLVRKGRNDAGEDTFFVQAGGGRAQGLTAGFPSRREALFAYDAIIIANVESDFFTKAQLQMTADFVAERGGGLLVFGGHSFDRRGLIGTPLEEVLPVELNDRRGGLARASLDLDRPSRTDAVSLTEAGARHPIMRLGATVDESRQAWAALPPLAASAALGGARPGATILAVTASGGAVVPLVAVQRYGRGRSMVFGGEASWRWRMMMPATDRSYEFFWRQALRWLSVAAPEPIDIAIPEGSETGDPITVTVDPRGPDFAPILDAEITATVTTPSGEAQTLTLRRDLGAATASAVFRPEAAGLYRVRADARRRSSTGGGSERWFYVGGSDRELAEPRLNDGVLRRLARSTGGKYVAATDAAQIGDLLTAAAPAAAPPQPRDLWHQPWALLLVIALLSAEWIMRRNWGLR